MSLAALEPMTAPDNAQSSQKPQRDSFDSTSPATAAQSRLTQSRAMDPAAHHSSDTTAAQAAATSSPAPAAPSPVVPRVVDQDCTCANCSYNLFGLSATGICPECATPVPDSFQNFLLQFADRSYLAALHRGATLILIGSIVFLAMSCITFAAASYRESGVETLTLGVVTMVVGMCVLYGVWLYTEPDPRIDGHRAAGRAHLLPRSRGFARFFAVCAGVLSVVTCLTLVGIITGFLDGSGFVAPLFLFFMSMLLVLPAIAILPCMLFYTRWLARRMPDPVLVRRCTTYRWLLPLLIFPGGILLIGPAVAFILYVLVLDLVGFRLRALQSPAEPVSEVH